jgi:hypothetical protein
MQVIESRIRTSRLSRRAARAKLAGSLRGDLSAVAMKLHQALERSDITVWANADSEIFFDAPEACPEIACNWLVGTYGVGASASDIEADLGVLRRECVPAAILD